MSGAAEPQRTAVSVVIPAWNAADTLSVALESLLTQTFPNWEAIVVDDGSSDATAAVARSYAASDRRIRTVEGPQVGVSAARNTGIGLARGEWLLFLDADDWLLPSLLQRLMDTVAADPSLDAVYSGWVRVAPDGTLIEQSSWREPPEELFAAFSRTCAFAIHSCIVRRARVLEVGGFDSSLRTCSDWDLWQRIARTGARFAAIPDALACYRMQPGSVSSNPGQLLQDGLRVIARGHAADSRVPKPAPAYAAGMGSEHLPRARLRFLCWVAGMRLGLGEDPRPLLAYVPDDHDAALDPEMVASLLLQAGSFRDRFSAEAQDELDMSIERHLDEFLLALERHAGAPGLAACARSAVLRQRRAGDTQPVPQMLRGVHTARVEITEPLQEVVTTASCLVCEVDLEGERLGTLHLPVRAGSVSAEEIRDAISARFAWLVLGRFFARTLYPHLTYQPDGEGLAAWRGRIRVAHGLPEEETARLLELHEQGGWLLFLQELWGEPAWRGGLFYRDDPLAVWYGRCLGLLQPGDPMLRLQRLTGRAPVRQVDREPLRVEASGALPRVQAHRNHVHVDLSVGGAPVGIYEVPLRGSRLLPEQLRSAIIQAAGFELCRVSVREALVGAPFVGAGTLRQRLAARARTAGTEE